MRIWKRTKFYWYEFVFEGRRVRASSKQSDRETAQSIASEHRSRLAKQGWGIERPKPIAVRELLDKLEADYKQNGKWSAQNRSLLARVRAEFGGKMSTELTDEDVTKYKNKKLSAKYAKATINRSLEILRRAYKLARLTPPVITRLDETDNVREGVFKPEEMQKVLSHLPDDGLRDYVAFAYSTGMRKGELSALRWSYVHGDTIIVPAGVCKNKKPHRIPVAGPLVAILKRRKASQSFDENGVTQIAEYIFHRGDGQPMEEFRKSWRTACTKAGCGNRIFHDLRRTCISDMIDAGVPQSTCMSISGHKTISVFLRYALSSDESKSEALEKTAQHQAR